MPKAAGLTHGKGMQSYLTMLVIVFFAAIAMMACGPSDTPTESDSSASPKQSEQSGPARLLDEASAISILQAYLQECALDWDDIYERKKRGAFYHREYERKMGRVVPTLAPADYQLPPSDQEKQSWLMGLATETVEGVAWSASYHGVTEVPKGYSPAGPARAETWVVFGPGFDRPDSTSVVPGRWKVYAGVEQVDYVDAAARLALEAYDSYDSCP